MSSDDKSGSGLSHVITFICVIIWLIVFWRMGMLLGIWPIIFAVVTSIIGVFPERTKGWYFAAATILLIIGIFTIPLDYLSDEGYSTLHRSCRRSMLATIYDKEKRKDADHDSFSIDCEEQGQGSDTDATRIPKLSGLTKNIIPSFNSQFKRTCQIPANATAFEFYHPGLIAKSARSYRFIIQGENLLCDVSDENKKDARMRCPFEPDFQEWFNMLKPGLFSMKMLVNIIGEADPVEFTISCEKL